ncbi:MAG: MBL fold metallo-hydrolase [Thermodesulfobacteriota bacterium]
MLFDGGVPVYLLDGERPTAVDAGFACLGPYYVQEAAQVLGGRGLHRLLITHSHFDHCGSASVMRRAYPGMRIMASAQAAGVLERPNAQALITSLNEAASLMMVQGGAPAAYPDPGFGPFAVDRALSAGDELAVADGITVCVLETPGHTRDCLSFFVKETGWLFTSEAAGIPDSTGYIFCECLVDFDTYRDSLARLCGLEVEKICLGHAGVVVSDARGYLAESLSGCDRFYTRVSEVLAENGEDIDASMAVIRAEEYDTKPFPKQPEPAYLLNLRARIGCVKRKRMNGS